MDLIPVPPELLQIHKDLHLAMDLMFINKLPFLVSVSKDLEFTTVEYVVDRKLPQIIRGVKRIFKFYKDRGFVLKTACVDNEFSSMIPDIPLLLNVASTNENLPLVERRIRVIKERVRALRHTLPLKRFTRLLVIESVNFFFRWLNAFPRKGDLKCITQ